MVHGCSSSSSSRAISSMQHQYHVDVDEYGDDEVSDYRIPQDFTLLEIQVAEALVWLANSSSKMEPLNAHRFVSVLPFEVYVPKKKRGSGGLGLLLKEGKTIDQETRMISTSTTSTTTSSGVFEQFLNPPCSSVPKEIKRTGDKLMKTTQNRVSVALDELDKKLIKIEKKVDPDKQIAGRKRRWIKHEGFEQAEEGKGSKKRMKTEKVDFKALGLDPRNPPDFSREIKVLISWNEETDKGFKFRLMKQLFGTDMSRDHGRFSMPLKQINDCPDFLGDGEKLELRKEDSEGVEVEVFDLLGLDHEILDSETMRLRQWEGNNAYMLTTSWKDVLVRHEEALKLKDIVQIYSFRRNGKLNLVLIKFSDGNGCREGAFGSSRIQGKDASDSSEGKINAVGASTSGEEMEC